VYLFCFLVFRAKAVVDEFSGYEGQVNNEFFDMVPGGCVFLSTEMPEYERATW
jgi:hypothetical protein